MNGDTGYGVMGMLFSAEDSGTIDSISLMEVSANGVALGCQSQGVRCPIVEYDGLRINQSRTLYNYLDVTGFADGTEIAILVRSTDDRTNVTEETFTIVVENTPTINTVSQSQELAENFESVTVTWGVEDRISAVNLYKESGEEITCIGEGEDNEGDGSCTFIPTESQSYTVKGTYLASNGVPFYATQTTNRINVDEDGDGTLHEDDNCFLTANTDQANQDNDEWGDACDPDKDGDDHADEDFDFNTIEEGYLGLNGMAAEDYEGTQDCDDTDSRRHPNQNKRLDGLDTNCEDEASFMSFLTDAWDLFGDDIEGGNVMRIYGTEEEGFTAIDFATLDFNADGYLDIAVTSLRDDLKGEVWLFLGSQERNNFANINFTREDADLIIVGMIAETSTSQSSPSAYADRMTRVAGGDFNGDRYDDLILGAPGNSAYNRLFMGRVSVIWGASDTDLADLYSQRELSIEDFLYADADDGDGVYSEGAYQDKALHFYGAYTYDMLGASLDVGDIDGDGKDEILVGSPEYPSDETAVDSEYSRTAMTNKGQAYVFYGPSNSSECQEACEFRVGIWGATDNEDQSWIKNMFNQLAGEFGSRATGKSASTLTNTKVLFLIGENAGDNFGSTIKFLGDIDDDGNTEVAITAPGYDTTSYNDAGAVYIFDEEFFETFEPRNKKFLEINIDRESGDSDYTYSEDNYYKYVIYGASDEEKLGSGVDTSGMTYSTSQTIASGDLDNDGLLDLVIGAPSYNNNEGRVYVFMNGALDISISTEYDVGQYATKYLTPDWRESASEFGTVVTVCDIDQSGGSDLVLSAIEDNSGQSAVYLYEGSVIEEYSDPDDGESKEVPYDQKYMSLFGSNSSAGHFGFGIECIDYNNDSKSDLIIGEPANDNEIENGGSLYIIQNEYEAE